MLKTQFPRLAAAVADMSLGERVAASEALLIRDHPVLNALAWELGHANLIEAVHFAELEADLCNARLAEGERQFAEAGIAEAPTASGPPVFLTEDELPKRA